MSAARNKTKRPLIAVVDLLCCLLMIFVLTANPKASPPHIETQGLFAVTATWKNGSNDDVDLYVRDPAGNTAYFAATSVGLMTLEHDDLGTAVSGTYTSHGKTIVVHENIERTIIKGIVPGEYVVDVQMYNRADPGPVTVTITLWELRGNDQVVTQRTVVLASNGQVATAFRFTLNLNANVTNVNRLPLNIVNQTMGG